MNRTFQGWLAASLLLFVISPFLDPSAFAGESVTGESAAAAEEVAIRNAKVPMAGVLTGGQPSEDQLRQAASSGFKTVVNLRPVDERGAWDEGPLSADLGMEYVYIPVASTDDLNEANAARLGEVLDDPEAYPVLVHCASGNRVGALFSVWAQKIEGKAPEDALEMGLRAGLTKLEETVRGILGLHE